MEVEKGLAFIIPEHIVKGPTAGERLVICNDIAKSVIDGERGVHPTSVFTYRNGLPQLSEPSMPLGKKLESMQS